MSRSSRGKCDRFRYALPILLTTPPCNSARHLGERRQNPRPRADAFVKAFEVVFLVRRMDVIVVEAKADQHGVEAERALEIGDDRDRGAGADQERFLAPLLG